MAKSQPGQRDKAESGRVSTLNESFSRKKSLTVDTSDASDILRVALPVSPACRMHRCTACAETAENGYFRLHEREQFQ
jgi:hypothetical protein